MQIIVKAERVIELPADKAVVYENLQRAFEQADKDGNNDLASRLDEQMHELIQEHVLEVIRDQDFFLHLDMYVTYDIPQTYADKVRD